MLTGLVCQLYYHGGGQLQYQNTLGVSSLVRFLSAPFVLQLGEKVSFSLLEADTSEAVDLQHPAPELVPTLTAKSDSKAKLPVRSVRFQRSIGRFLNAEAEERSEMIAHAERQLEILIHDESPDGDAICRVVRRCAGWLRVPVFATAVSKEAASPSKEGKGCSENLQSRVRKLLISCLAHLDLADANTQEALEPALEYLVQILDKLDFPTHLSTLAAGQWRKLQKLLDETRSETGTETLEKAPKLRRATKSSGVQDSFVPPPQVKSLPEVFTSEQSVKVKCSQCEYIFSCNWFWRHPKTKKAHVLVPSMGHAACEKRLGRRISKRAWVPLESWSMCPLSLLMPITCYFVSTINASPIVFNVVVGKSVLTKSDASDARCARRPMLKTGKGSKLTLIDEVQGIQIARNEQHFNLKNLEALASQVFATGITTAYSSF